MDELGKNYLKSTGIRKVNKLSLSWNTLVGGGGAGDVSGVTHADIDYSYQRSNHY